MEIPFENLNNADLIVDAIYKGGEDKNARAEVLSKLMGCGVSGGFRKVLRKDESRLPAYVILYTSMEELEWPDYLDEETGIFRYYGDNREPGKTLNNTSKKGNLLLEQTFELLNRKDDSIKNIPPFFVFKKTGNKRDVQFLGLAAPGNPHISPDKDLVSFWRTMNGKRFQNYEAYFTILDTKAPISQKWLTALINDHDNSLQFAPEPWKRFIKQGRNGITPLIAKKIKKIPSNYDQLQCSNEGNYCINAIRKHYESNAYGFEMCAKDILEKMDDHFQDFSLTRPWRDGGRDAIGYYMIGMESKANYQLKIDCALEAKCKNEKNSVGVREMSRLISRIRYRQFGVMLTTSYVHEQAYREVVDDGHPILIITASDIATILQRNAITSSNINDWLKSLDEMDERFKK